MPIQVATEITALGQPEFYELSHKVLRIVFDVHNEFGRLLDETLYKAEIAARWVEAGLGRVQREIPIEVTHGTFRKSYFMDLLVNGTLMIEAKAAETLTANHRMQGLN